MPTILKTKNSVTTTVAPTTLAQGELAVNITDKKMWVGNAATTPVQLFGAGADGSFVNLAYTGTLTGGTGIVNLGSGQFYKDASGNVSIGTNSPLQRLDVASTATAVFQTIRSTSSGATNVALRIQDGTTGTSNTDGIYLGRTGAENYLWTYENEPWIFATNNTERMRIDSSGRVLIGTTTAVEKLTVVDTNPVVATFKSDSASGAGYYIDNSGRASGKKFGVLVGNVANGAFSIKDETAGVDRLVIDSSGNLLVGRTGQTSTERLGVTFAAGNSGIYTQVASTATQFHMSFNNGSVVGAISTNGSATTYSTSSDYRLKENIAPMTGALAKVSALKPCTYTWKADGSNGQGFIAHELQEVVPDCVTGEKDGEQMQGVDTSFLVATLTAAIQEQQALIQNLTTRLNALEGK